ncbi:ABC transporter permease [Pacificibacter marinus]|jgi:putative spermidine/putrescine transport system permease protein|uniref:Inner membrane ABC transporter permease protein YdcV n=1 Tax=Pacificibacter marinus TaxID=658057 RepID=A0A1Y5S0N1_9RHOB|nr:ABC transporter permease [Pacificibacter marinus]SEK35948.1 putative spermidine/putrescine transport system permease protein [Pacificibacter marinus]SLN27285.1 Inner membrane ABC transporter permease protein YdcV [Pacificibacter marinus]
MQSGILRPALATYTALFLLFLYGPMIVLAILSFQSIDGGPQFPIRDWSTYWYQHLLGLAESSRVSQLPVGESLVRSMMLAFMTTVVSTILGVMSAEAFRTKFKGSGPAFYLIILGMMVPGVLVGLGMALLSNTLGIGRAWWSTSFVLHVVYTYPFAFLIMLAIFNRFDRTVEEASLSLGVTPAQTFRRVTFPIIFPGVLSAMLFSFTLSYDEFARTLFTAGRDLTLPLSIYGTFSVEIYPNLFAFGVLTTLFSFTLLVIYGLLMKRFTAKASRFSGQEDAA